MEKILSLTVSVAVKSEAVKVKDLKKVIVDTTVMPKNIEFPTDSKLYNKALLTIIGSLVAESKLGKKKK